MRRFMAPGAGLALLFTLALTTVFSATFAPSTLAARMKTTPSVFMLEHQHGAAKKGVAPGQVFTYNCKAQGAVPGNKIIAVTEKVIHDADSGQAGDYWALDAFARTITVWNVGADSYCIIVNYPTASFASFAGQQSPGSTGGNGGLETGDEVGTFAGAAQFLVTGQLDFTNPAVWPATGNVNSGNTVDYMCDNTGNCPGYMDFTAQYFASGATITEPLWGWVYTGKDKLSAPDHGTPDGTWVNAYSGNSGDILDVD